MASLELESTGMVGGNGRMLLDGVNASFHSREFTVIAGPGGSGKTCLVRLIAGDATPSSGVIRYEGTALRGRRSFLPARISLVPQQPAERFIARTVAAELAFGLAPSPIHAGLLAWAQLDHLAAEDPRNLSFGEQRRLAIASALAAEPDFLILDDPFPGLDHGFIPLLLGKLVDWHAAGHGVIIVSNEFEKILAHADRLVLMKQGRIIADALPERVLPYLDAHGFRKPAMKLVEMSWLKT